MYTVVVAALAVSLVVGANRLWAAADERGQAPEARKNAPATTVAPTTARHGPRPGHHHPRVSPPRRRPGPVKAASVAASAQTGPGPERLRPDHDVRPGQRAGRQPGHGLAVPR